MNETTSPGPWIVTGLNVRTESGRFIARCSADPMHSAPEDRANARLIASAPALLEALREIERRAGTPVDEQEVWTDDLLPLVANLARAALAQAE